LWALADNSACELNMPKITDTISKCDPHETLISRWKLTLKAFAIRGTERIFFAAGANSHVNCASVHPQKKIYARSADGESVQRQLSFHLVSATAASFPNTSV